MNHVKNVGKLGVNGVKQLHMSSALKVKPSIPLNQSKEAVTPYCPRIRELQTKFQVENDVPVHLKGGPMDKVFYYATGIACTMGISLSVAYLGKLSYST
ncbi:cytochrome c oxidase subunit 7A1, mitochondrial-like [Arctopsyche grandis]|uniref:cytochrome c oxidase subunit 7A1, mitochondrial-like n=1 Tax=Arctopsyche grandis TaxID=121162 RepID=UPI00406D774A